MINNIEISKELLSEVLGYTDEDYVIVATEKDIFLDKNYLHYEYQDPYCTPETYITIKDKINIYELAHKCKEYALNKGYYLRAEQGVNYKDNLQWAAFLNTDMDDGADYVDYWNNTEPEAIFKACEWILKEIKK